MSQSVTSPFSKQSCGNPGRGSLSDIFGNATHLQVVGSDPDVNGIKTGASITALTGSYAPDPEFTNNGTFLICIETEGVFYVHLEDGTDFFISAAQSTAYLGQWYPAKLLSVDVGTTGNFSVGY
ncbi:MAG TPA: hypothetical protein VIJ25_08230 [Methylococcales bacterium]